MRLLALTLVVASSSFADVAAPLHVYECTFRRAFPTTSPGNPVKARMEVQPGCAMLEELAIGDFLATAQGCVGPGKEDISLYLYHLDETRPTASTEAQGFPKKIEVKQKAGTEEYALVCERN